MKLRSGLLLGWLAAVSIPGIASSQVEPALSSRDSAFHLLNRLAYGPKPGQIDEVVRTGVARWLQSQLAATLSGDDARSAWDDRFAVRHYSERDLAQLERSVRRERMEARRQMAADSTAGNPAMPRQSENVRTLRTVGAELQQLAVVRAAVAEHQLYEVMVDFWINHFNVFYGKGLDRVYLPAYIEETIRPRALGRFEDLLLAVAQSPAMLLYLDQAQSVAPNAVPPVRPRAARARARRTGSPPSSPPAVRPTGLNENYARELLELHTLGVEGGYAQADVVGVARILTGWSIDRPGEGGDFLFRDWAHDRGEKTVLGVRFPAGHGQDEGVRLLGLLARHPSTMHFVSAKLCARFVNDDPPDGCVDAAVSAWERSHGEIREVLRAIFASPEFWSPHNVRAKIKTPLEFVVSAARAVGAEPDTLPGLARAVARLGQPLYLQSVPTGYPEQQNDWVNSGALLNRMNVALALAANRLPGAAVHLDQLLPPVSDPTALVEAVDRLILGGQMSANTRTVILREIAQTADPAQQRALAVGLALGGPEFQRQ